MGAGTVKQDLGKLLLENGQISPEELERAKEEASKSGEPIGKVLLRLGIISENNIKTVLELHYAVNYLDLKKITPSSTLIGLLPIEVIKKHELIPATVEGNRLTLAMVTPDDKEKYY